MQKYFSAFGPLSFNIDKNKYANSFSAEISQPQHNLTNYNTSKIRSSESHWRTTYYDHRFCRLIRNSIFCVIPKSLFPVCLINLKLLLLFYDSLRESQIRLSFLFE